MSEELGLCQPGARNNTCHPSCDTQRQQCSFGRTVKKHNITHRPDLCVMPVDDGVHPHKGGPVAVGRVEVGQGGAVGVCPAGADEDGLEAGAVAQVGLEGGAHGQGVAAQVEVVGGGGVLDEGVDLGEGVGGHDVDGLQGRGEGPRGRAAHRCRRGGRVGWDLRGQAVGGGGVGIGLVQRW